MMTHTCCVSGRSSKVYDHSSIKQLTTVSTNIFLVTTNRGELSFILPCFSIPTPHVRSWIFVVNFFIIFISPTSVKAQLMLELWQGVGQSKGLLSQGIGECCGSSGDCCIQVEWFDCTASTRGGHSTNQYISSCTGNTPCNTSIQLPVKSDFHLLVALLICKTTFNVLNCVKWKLHSISKCKWPAFNAEAVSIHTLQGLTSSRKVFTCI